MGGYESWIPWESFEICTLVQEKSHLLDTALNARRSLDYTTTPCFNICYLCRSPCGPGDWPATSLQGFSTSQSSHTSGKSFLSFLLEPAPSLLSRRNSSYKSLCMCGVSPSREREDGMPWCCSFSYLSHKAGAEWTKTGSKPASAKYFLPTWESRGNSPLQATHSYLVGA